MGSLNILGKRILVCDDEPFLLRLVAHSFEKLGFEVVTAKDGREALDILKSQSIFACILDIMMPHVDGLEVLKWIRTTPAKEGMMVIMLTVKAQESEVLEAYHCGADLYLTKPFSPDDIQRCAELISQYSF